jgi:hypothetical protein
MLAAVVAAAALGCSPQPGLGSVAYVRSGALHVLDVASCRDRVLVRRGAHGPVRFVHGHVELGRRAAAAAVRSPNGKLVATASAKGVIRVGGRVVYRARPRWPILVLRWSPDSRWLLFTVDPWGSASLAADGLVLRIVPAAGGRARTIGTALGDADYTTWCGRTLVATLGRDRIATHDKRLVAASAPDWRPRPLVSAQDLAWGSLTCAPDGRRVAVLSQRASNDANFFSKRWQLWQVGLDGSRRLLDAPPAGFADESPRWSRDGRAVLFVRVHRGSGRLFAWRDGRVSGPLAPVGYRLGYYGHADWWQSMAWSLGAQ